MLQALPLHQRLVHFTSGENTSSCFSRRCWRKQLKYILSTIHEKPVFYFKQVLKQHRGNLKKIPKDDYQLFWRLFISYQNRQCDLQEIFKHENQTTPASLGSGGQLHLCQNSQLTELHQAQVDIPDKETRRRYNLNRWISTNPVPTSMYFEIIWWIC